jgi:signal transduction histidine kinase
LHARNETLPLAPFLAGISGRWAPRFGGRLTSAVAPGTPDAAADPHVLRRVVDNLLMNAEVHGGPEVSVDVEAGMTSAGMVRIVVRDDGPGIPERDAERVFEPLVRLGTESGRQSSGLGLTYCRAALEAMGGSIRLKPGGSGSTFVVEVPAASISTVTAEYGA